MARWEGLSTAVALGFIWWNFTPSIFLTANAMLILFYLTSSPSKGSRGQRHHSDLKDFQPLRALKSFKFMLQMTDKDVDEFCNSYKIFDYDYTDHDAIVKEYGEGYYDQVQKDVATYYNVLNHLLAIGQVEKMYIPPAIDLSVGVQENQFLYEKKIYEDLGAKEGHKVLDFGCGRGRISAHVSHMTGAELYGFNICKYQIESAKEFAVKMNLADRTNFILHDMNDHPLPYPDNFFDGIYSVQSSSYAKDRVALLKELSRILKPGGKISILGYFLLPDYDPTNAYHKQIFDKFKPLLGAMSSHSVKDMTGFIEEAGLDLVQSEEPSIDGIQAPLIESADVFYKAVKSVINTCTTVGILSMRYRKLFERLCKDCEYFTLANKMRLMTTTWHFVMQKKIQ